jgi:succinoglycan biosynthesis protein ExoM
VTGGSNANMTAASRAPRVRVVVGVCTFRRSSVLTAIESIAAQIVPDDVDMRIVVVDNDSEPTAEKLITDFCERTGRAVQYKHVPGQNISVARNACLDAATGSDWLAFMDDDEYASYSWLSKLLEARKGANAVLGPCKAIYGPTAPDWIRVGDYHSCSSMGTEPITIGHTANALIDMRFVNQNVLRFDVALGNTGGEDTFFFHEIYRRGGSLKFEPQAIVYEDVAESRLNLRWIGRRKYRAGQTYALMVLRFEPHRRTTLAFSAAYKFVFCLFMGAILVVRPARALSSLMRAILHLGVMSYCLGANIHQEYRKKGG